MSRSSTLLVLGALVLVLPFAGLPSSWLRTLLVFVAIAILAVGISLRAEGVRLARTALEEKSLPREEAPTAL